MNRPNDNPKPQSLREQVESLLPAWQSWYPSLFDAAEDLGLIRARVCAPSLLALSNRHASIRNEAVQAFREHWSVEDEPVLQPNSTKGKKNSQHRSGSRREPSSPTGRSQADNNGTLHDEDVMGPADEID